jgi:hypothetical protein
MPLALRSAAMNFPIVFFSMVISVLPPRGIHFFAIILPFRQKKYNPEEWESLPK